MEQIQNLVIDLILSPSIWKLIPKLNQENLYRTNKTVKETVSSRAKM